MPCQLMVGFFAYAKSLEINVDKEELEGTLNVQKCNGIYNFIFWVALFFENIISVLLLCNSYVIFLHFWKTK